MLVTLKSNVSDLGGVGDKYLKGLQKIGIETVEDLLLHFPKRWEDFSDIVPISFVKAPGSYCIKGTIWSIGNKRSRLKRMSITEAIIGDDKGTIKVVWFNQPFLIKNLKVGEEILIAGKVESRFGEAVFVSPGYEKSQAGTEYTHMGRIVPIYPETTNITSRWLRNQMSKTMKLIYSFKEYLPEQILKNQNLLTYPAAVRQLHFPETNYQIQKAKERISFDEMFLLQLAVQKERKQIDQEKAVSISFKEKEGKDFVNSLGFSLTADQKKAAWEIIKDLEKPIPMNRLLEGDVGSGKTVVATMAALTAALNGFQTAFLAPTEILALQHHEKISKMLEPFEIKVSLLLGKTKKAEKDLILKSIREGESMIVIGTHSLLNEAINWWKLALVIVDEQHRFGIDQRSKLKQRNDDGVMPHFLSMSATPIPRTLAISIYGDLDISIIKEMPPGRKKVSTFVIPREKRDDSYEFIRQQIQKGRQVFVVCPLIDDSEKMEVKSVTAEYEKLKNVIFPEFRIEMLHGKMPATSKERLMEKFANGGADILISTSLVEVGVDVPNATIMLIEGADRFGLAQLHQFRGRVGRGMHQSYCFLFTESKSELVEKRLSVITQTQSGFEIAERDLEIRGPGEVIGTRQHGFPDFNMKNLMNAELVARTKREAVNFLAKYNVEDFPLLKEKIKKYESIAILE